MNRILETVLFFGVAAIFSTAFPTLAGVVTGSFYILDGQTTYPALFEIRKDDGGQAVAGAILWDRFYDSSNPTFAADGKLKTIDVALGQAGIVHADLETGTMVDRFGNSLGLDRIQQTVSSDPLPGEIALGIRKSGSNVELSWNAVQASAVQIEFLTSLSTASTNWQLKAVTLAPASTWQESISPTNPHAFYRASHPVVINGSPLSVAQLTEFETIYSVRPRPGNYWYDATSGLYGAVGYPAFGFLRTNHNYGTLARDASIGNTSVLINGRELSLSEWFVWSQIVGEPIRANSYWLDGNGNAGVGTTPSGSASVGNLYTRAKDNNYGGGGDNYWSTRFSAGNYDPSQGIGYVSVPGYGPVDFGF